MTSRGASTPCPPKWTPEVRYLHQLKIKNTADGCTNTTTPTSLANKMLLKKKSDPIVVSVFESVVLRGNVWNIGKQVYLCSLHPLKWVCLIITLHETTVTRIPYHKLKGITRVSHNIYKTYFDTLYNNGWTHVNKNIIYSSGVHFGNNSQIQSVLLYHTPLHLGIESRLIQYSLDTNW